MNLCAQAQIESFFFFLTLVVFSKYQKLKYIIVKFLVAQKKCKLDLKIPYNHTWYIDTIFYPPHF